MTTAEVRAQALLLDGAAAAYRFGPVGDGPDDPCLLCGHRLAGHAGDDWDGRCTADGCACEGSR